MTKKSQSVLRETDGCTTFFHHRFHTDCCGTETKPLSTYSNYQHQKWHDLVLYKLCMKETGKRNKSLYNCLFICTAKHSSYDSFEQILVKCVIDLHISFVPW